MNRTLLNKKSSIVFAFLLVMLLLGSVEFYALVGAIEDTNSSIDQDVSIISGEVKSIESHWEDKVIYSYVTIFVICVEKGQASLKNREIVIKHLGGGVDGVAMWRSDQPTFHIGEKARLRIREAMARFVLVNGAQGKISLESDIQSVEARTVAGYKLFWFGPPGEWAMSTSRPGPDWYGPARWNDADMPVEYYIDTTGTPSGIAESDFIEYAQKCYQTWEDDPGSHIDYSCAGTKSDAAFGDNDGVNIFCWKDIDGGGGTLGLCNIWVSYTPSSYDSLRITDSDVALDNGDAWSAATTCPPDMLDVQNIGTHEAGHNVGLADLYDSGDSEMTMYGYGSLGETKKRTLEWGDIAGINFIYPISGLYVPSLVSPSNGASVSATPTLQWGSVAGATFYMPEVWDGSTLVWRDWPGTTWFKVPSGRLSPGVTYQWRVYAANGQGYGPPSGFWSFTVAGGLYAPVLVSPSNGASVSATPTLQWGSVAGATFYMPEVWDGSTLVWRDWPGTTWFKVPSGRLSPGVTYQWRVYAANGQGYGPPSGFWSFTVAAGLSAADMSDKIASSLLVSQQCAVHVTEWGAGSGLWIGASVYMLLSSDGSDPVASAKILADFSASFGYSEKYTLVAVSRANDSRSMSVEFDCTCRVNLADRFFE